MKAGDAVHWWAGRRRLAGGRAGVPAPAAGPTCSRAPLQNSPFPAYDRVKPEHVVPGIRALLAELHAEVDKLEQAVQPTWEVGWCGAAALFGHHPVSNGWRAMSGRPGAGWVLLCRCIITSYLAGGFSAAGVVTLCAHPAWGTSSLTDPTKGYLAFCSRVSPGECTRAAASAGSD